MGHGLEETHACIEESCTPFERFNLSTAPFQPGNQCVRGPIPIKIRKIIVRIGRIRFNLCHWPVNSMPRFLSAHLNMLFVILLARIHIYFSMRFEQFLSIKFELFFEFFNDDSSGKILYPERIISKIIINRHVGVSGMFKIRKIISFYSFYSFYHQLSKHR